MQDKTETDPGPLRSGERNYLTSKYSSFESRKKIFTKDTPATAAAKGPVLRRNWRYQSKSLETETDNHKDPGVKDPVNDCKNNNEITGNSKVDAEKARNIYLENDKSVSVEDVVPP